MSMPNAKNAYVTFSANNAKLTVSLVKRKDSFCVKFKTRAADGKEQEGAPTYYDPTEAGLKEAQTRFDELTANAKEQGWKEVATTARTSNKMLEIPKPESVVPAATGPLVGGASKDAGKKK